jgi:Glycosyl transferase family 2
MDEHLASPVVPPPRVSVVMPVYNAESYLEEAIESVLGQTLEQLELVAVDDGSKDGSRAILERFARMDRRVTIVANERNLGMSGARNRGWRAARSPYIASLDADDVALPRRLSRQVDFLDAHPNVAAVGGAAVTIDAAGRHISTRRYPTSNRVIRSALLRHNCLAHSAVTMRRSAVEAVGGYRFRNASDDYDLWLRLSPRFPLANLSEPVVLHRLHPNQESVRTVERQVREALIVLAAAQARRTSGVDPLEGVEDLSGEGLGRVKIDEGTLRAAIKRESIAQAAILADLAHHEEAARLIARASELDGDRAAKAFSATTELKHAEALLRARRLLPAGEHVLRAFREDPLHASRLLTRWLGPRVPGASLLRWA